jgi:hypothetical protein
MVVIMVELLANQIMWGAITAWIGVKVVRCIRDLTVGAIRTLRSQDHGGQRSLLGWSRTAVKRPNLQL